MNEIKYTYIRENTRTPGRPGRVITLARRWADEEHTKIEYSVATCNPKDAFVKAMGRKIANGRMDVGRSVTVGVGTDRTPEEAVVINYVQFHFAEAFSSRKAIAKWLYERSCRQQDRTHNCV